MKGSRFKEIGCEQKHFVILERIENDGPVSFNTPANMEEQLERIAPDSTNDQWFWAEGFAKRDENPALRSIPLKDHAGTIGFSEYGWLAYEIAFIEEVRIDDFEH
jgi:hypothetical protein